MGETFSNDEHAAVYKAIALRRDIRRQFEPTPIPHDVLARILSAAHHAGSVGFMQPWDFILIDDCSGSLRWTGFITDDGTGCAWHPLVESTFLFRSRTGGGSVIPGLAASGHWRTLSSVDWCADVLDHL